MWENKKLDEKFGSRVAPIDRQTGDSAGKESAVAEENYGPTFRYIL